MSISNRHTLALFVAGKSEAMADQRLAKVGYKTTKKQKAKFPSVFASVPMIPESEITSNILPLVTHLRTLLETAQDGIIKSLYESAAGELIAVSDEDISVTACVAFLESEAQGGRLTREMVAEWFDSDVTDSLTVILADKLGFEDINSDQQKVIDKYIAGYKGVFQALAGGKTLLNPLQIRSCKTVLSVLEGSEIGNKMNAKLVAMETKPVFADLLEL